MTLNLLAISVGNTRTKMGAVVEGKLAAATSVENSEASLLGSGQSEALTALEGLENWTVLVASVNPPVLRRVRRELAATLPETKVYRIEEDFPVPIGRQLDPETIVGDDRLLNAAAAFDTVKQACVVVDAGTALTVDFVDGAGTFHGGAICPGFRLMLQSLHEHTSQLPEVTQGRPIEAIGHNTAEAMRSGAFHGIRGVVRELTEKFAESVGAYPLVVATGGDAELLFGDYDLVDRVVPDLVLLGLAVTMKAAISTDG